MHLRQAGQCWWTARGYHKKPVILNLRNTGLTGRHDRCYMAGTGACDTKISGEHLISESVLKVLADKQVELSGLPWLKGQKKMLGFGALTTNCLCARHNSLLSPIDTVGAKLFEAIQKCGTTDSGPGQLFLLSGHDVERWMLRSLAIFGVSGNFSIDGAVIDPDFVNRLRIVELLEDVKQWTKPLGFYLTRGLKILPQLRQPQHRLRDAAGQHVEGDELADREFPVDDEIGPEIQRRRGDELVDQLHALARPSTLRPADLGKLIQKEGATH